MKKTFAFIFLFILTSCGSNNNSNVKVIENLRVDTTTSKKKFDARIFLGCGYEGKRSKQFDSTKKLILKKDYKSISKNLRSQDLIIQITSVVVMETFNERKVITLSKDEQDLINKIKTYKKSCSICQGCTGHYTMTVSDIFKKENPKNITREIRYATGLMLD